MTSLPKLLIVEMMTKNEWTSGKPLLMGRTGFNIAEKPAIYVRFDGRSKSLGPVNWNKWNLGVWQREPLLGGGTGGTASSLKSLRKKKFS